MKRIKIYKITTNIGVGYFISANSIGEAEQKFVKEFKNKDIVSIEFLMDVLL